MSSTDEILADADAALDAAIAAPGRERIRDQVRELGRFMAALEQLARAAVAGASPWPDARAWAVRRAERLVAAREALGAWEDEMWSDLMHHGEPGAERALTARSRHALAQALFGATPASAWLVTHGAFDRELHAQAERLALEAPGWVPRSHAWWLWTPQRLAQPIAPEPSSGSPRGAAVPAPVKRGATVPAAARAGILAGLRPESDHAAALPDPLPLDRLLVIADRSRQTTEQLRARAGRDERGYFLDYYRVDNDGQTSWHGRIRDDGRAEELETIEGQLGRRVFQDPADTERERLRLIAHNRRAREILNKKGFA